METFSLFLISRQQILISQQRISASLKTSLSRSLCRPVSGFTRPDHCPAPCRGIAGRSFSAARIWRRCSALSAVNWKPYSVPSARTTFAGITCLSQSGSGISSVTDSLSMRASATNAPTPLTHGGSNSVGAVLPEPPGPRPHGGGVLSRGI